MLSWIAGALLLGDLGAELLRPAGLCVTPGLGGFRSRDLFAVDLGRVLTRHAGEVERVAATPEDEDQRDRERVPAMPTICGCAYRREFVCSIPCS